VDGLEGGRAHEHVDVADEGRNSVLDQSIELSMGRH
jgi:hypothetical protein